MSTYSIKLTEAMENPEKLKVLTDTMNEIQGAMIKPVDIADILSGEW